MQCRTRNRNAVLDDSARPWDRLLLGSSLDIDSREKDFAKQKREHRGEVSRVTVNVLGLVATRISFFLIRLSIAISKVGHFGRSAHPARVEDVSVGTNHEYSSADKNSWNIIACSKHRSTSLPQIPIYTSAISLSRRMVDRVAAAAGVLRPVVSAFVQRGEPLRRLLKMFVGLTRRSMHHQRRSFRSPCSSRCPPSVS